MSGKIGQKIISVVTTLILIVTLYAPFYQSLQIKETTAENPPGWSDDIRLTNSISPDAYPAIATYQENVHIVWRDIWGGDGRVFYKNSSDSGQAWSTSNQLNIGGDGDYPDIAVKSDEIYVVYHDNIGVSTDEIAYCNSSDGGVTWSIPKYISTDDTYNSQAPKIVVSEDGMSIHVVWVDSRYSDMSSPPNTELYYNRSLDGGVTWAGEQRLTNAPYGTTGPINIRYNDTNLHITFLDERNGTFGLYYIRSTDNGATWDDGKNNVGAASLISTTSVLQASMAINKTVIHTVWVNEQAGPACRIYYQNSSDNGGNWSTPILLTGPNDGSYAPDIGVDGDEVWVFWNDNRDDSSTPELVFV